MNRPLAAVLVASLFVASSHAAPLYTGIQADANSIGLLFGNTIDKTYSVEVNIMYSNTKIEHSGVSVDTKASKVGLSGIARLPLKLADGQPYTLFGRAGVAYVSKEESYYIPTSVTLTQPYSGKSTSHGLKPMLGGGAELDITRSVAARVELGFTGKDRAIGVAAIYSF